MTPENAPPSPPIGPLARLSYWQSWLLVALLVGISAVWFVLDWVRKPPPQVPSHQVTAVSPQFQLLATWTQYALTLPPVVGDGRVVFVGTVNAAQDRPALIALNVVTGAIAWQIDPDTITRPTAWPDSLNWSAPVTYRWSGLVSHAGRVFATEAYLLQTAVSAYYLTNGTRDWQHKLGMINGSDADYMALNGEQVLVHVNDGNFNAFYMLNDENGRLETQRSDGALAIFLIEKEPDRVYEAVPGGILLNGAALWQPPDAGCGIIPQVVRDLIVAQVQECDSPLSRVYALDRFTGELRWQLQPPIVGNIALNDAGLLFLLTPDGLLRVVDVGTGKGAGSVTLAPDLQQFMGLDTAVFYVAAQDDLTAVYTGDSQQLFVFRYTPTVQ